MGTWFIPGIHRVEDPPCSHCTPSQILPFQGYFGFDRLLNLTLRFEDILPRSLGRLVVCAVNDIDWIIDACLIPSLRKLVTESEADASRLKEIAAYTTPPSFCAGVRELSEACEKAGVAFTWIDGRCEYCYSIATKYFGEPDRKPESAG